MPRFVYRFAVWLRSTFSRNRVQQDLDEEFQFHLDHLIEHHVHRGMTPQEARYAALRAMDGMERQKERCRDLGRVALAEDAVRDVRHALRLMRRAPGFTAVAIVSIAVGVGTSTAVFGAVDALLFRKLAVAHPEELVSSHGGSYPLLKGFQGLGDIFADVAGICLLDRYNVTSGETGGATDPGPVRVALVTGNYLPMLGVHARIGRELTPDDDRRPGGHPVAVLSDRYWQRRFGSDAAAIGRTLSLNGVTYTVVGVMAPPFSGDAVGRPVDIWIPTMMQSQVMTEMPGLLARSTGWLRIVGRLRPGVTRERARDAMQSIYTRSELENAGANASPQTIQTIQRDRFELVSIAAGYSRERDTFALSLAIVAVIVSLVLVVACANLANLLLARAEARHREMAVRLAIGGSRARLARQLLTESVVLAMAGGGAGIVFAAWFTSALSTTMRFGPTQMDSRAPSAWMSFDLQLDARGFVFSVALCVVAGVVFGLAPALRAARTSLTAVLGGRDVNGGTPRGSRTGDILVVAQVALSLMLVAGAGLFVRSIQNMKGLDLGIEPEHLLLVWADPGQTTPTAGLIEAARAIRERVGRIPGILSVSMSNHGLLEGNEGGMPSEIIVVDGHPAAPGLQAFRDAVAPGFFRATGTPVIAGREFDERDSPAAPHVIVINKSLASLLFGDANAVGRKIGLPTDRQPIEIVGVVKDVKHGTPRDARGVWYVPAAQYPGLMRTMCIAIRTAGEPANSAVAVRTELHAFDPKLPILRIDTISEQLDEVLVHERTVAQLAIAFGALAVFVAAIGIYGIVSYTLARRTNEIGVRMALGASQSRIMRMVFGDVLIRTTLGVLIGVPAAVALASLAASRLYGVGVADPLTMGAAACIVVALSMAACIAPARHAAFIDPMAAMRSE